MFSEVQDGARLHRTQWNFIESCDIWSGSVAFSGVCHSLLDRGGAWDVPCDQGGSVAVGA